MNKISHSLALQYKKLDSQICSLASLLKNTHKSTFLVKFTYFFIGGFIHKSHRLGMYFQVYTSSLANHKLCLRGGTAIITICHIQFCWPITFAAINYYYKRTEKKYCVSLTDLWRMGGRHLFTFLFPEKKPQDVLKKRLGRKMCTLRW